MPTHESRAADVGASQTLVRVYKAKSQADAVAQFQADATRLAFSGYRPVAQSWAQGQWGCGAFLLAVILFIVLIGILIFIYMLLVKPDGTLTVTYSRVDTQAATAETAKSDESGPMKTCPQCAEQVKEAAKICRFCRYEFPDPTSQTAD